MSNEELPIKEDLEKIEDTLKNNPNWKKRFGAASKLYRLGKEKAVDPLIHSLQNDHHPEIRRFSAVLLGELGDERASWALIATLRDAVQQQNTLMINTTKEALLNIKGSEITSILASTVDDEEESLKMRYESLALLEEINGMDVVQALIAILKKGGIDFRVYHQILRTLVFTGNLAAIQFILNFLEETEVFETQKVIIEAIGETPFKNRTIAIRIGKSLVKLFEAEQEKEKVKQSLMPCLSKTIQALATNIGLEWKEYLTEVVKVTKQEKK
jgi:hypothetical protein